MKQCLNPRRSGQWDRRGEHVVGGCLAPQGLFLLIQAELAPRPALQSLILQLREEPQGTGCNISQVPQSPRSPARVWACQPEGPPVAIS